MDTAALTSTSTVTRVVALIAAGHEAIKKSLQVLNPSLVNPNQRIPRPLKEKVDLFLLTCFCSRELSKTTDIKANIYSLYSPRKICVVRYKRGTVGQPWNAPFGM